MKYQAKKFAVLGYELNAQQLSVGLLTLSGVVAFCLLLGFQVIGISLLAAAAFGVLVWAVHLNEFSEPASVRYAQLRRRVQLLRSDSQPIDTPLPVVMSLACIVAIFCSWNLLNAYTQYSARDYPSVLGLMTRHEMVDVDLSSALEVDYTYTVAGQNFMGHRKRFLFRPFRVGTDQAKLLAANWHRGARIPVFYDSSNPARAAIDNTFCKGDQLFVGLNIVGIVAAFLAVGLFGYFRWLRTSRRKLQVETDSVPDVVVIKLSNVPFYGMFGLSITAVSFVLLIVAQVGGLMSMGNGPVDWLVSAIDSMVAITGGLLTASLVCCAAERMSYGRRGRICEIDRLRKQVMVQTERFAEKLTIDFGHIDSMRVVSSRESWVRFGRTFSPTIFFREHAGSNSQVVLQRNLNRIQAIEMIDYLRNILGLDSDSKCEGARIFDGCPAASTNVDSPASMYLVASNRVS